MLPVVQASWQIVVFLVLNFGLSFVEGIRESSCEEILIILNHPASSRVKSVCRILRWVNC